MKTKIFFIGLLSCICSSICYADEPIYGCDFTAQWATDNAEVLREITRDEFLLLERDYQLAILNLFTAEEGLRFDMLRYDDLLALDWSLGERDFVTEARDFFVAHPELYEKEWRQNKELRDLLESHESEWLERATNEFGWSQAVMNGFSPYVKMIDTDGTLAKIETKSPAEVVQLVSSRQSAE